ncbi:AAA family ATPase [Pseudacidobacterium ailaaui]|uniref:AAA family ATPase n=1 Tax=Pseudacidobacterium ailaaui TaxID=1382359 RepID=UPI0005D254E6|nr:AAA family ATPase [Pseudacidobacterium ailaaui]MBX6358689.1 AAA family ATPase [Pseudacidobacterium ailaaui]
MVGLDPKRVFCTTWVLLAGLPATGKSTLAHRLAEQLEQAVILDKDRVRQALFPGPMTDYSDEQNSISMKAILEAAQYLTRQRLARYIFFDGRTFSRFKHIEEVCMAAEAVGARWRILHLFCTDQVATRRLHSPDLKHPARNRDMALYYRLKAAFETIPHPKLDLDTSGGIEDLLPDALAYISI